MTTKEWAAPTITESIHRRAWELLHDGRWYDYEEVVLELMKVIPPGMALRRAKERWLMSANTPKKLEARGGKRLTERVEWRSKAEQVQVGARDWVIATLQPRATRERNLSVYEYDPPTIHRAGANGHSHFAGRKIRMSGPNRVIKGDLKRQPWLKPVLNHLASQAITVGDEWAAGAVRQAAHEQGFHLATCPQDCTLSPSPLQPLED